MKKKLLSIVLSLTMIVTMMPYGVFAAAEADGAASQDKTAAEQTGQETGSGAEEAGNPADAETSQSGDAEMPDESVQQPDEADTSGDTAETQTNDKSLSEPAEPVKEPEQTDDSDVKADSRTEYVWKSDSTKVTAVLSDPEAVSDDAKLIVTPINKDSDGYSYKAYMEALNDSSEAEYTEENTKLYDIAFIKDGTEIHPSKGKVSVTFEFLDPQLSEAIGAKDDSDVSVIHLPVKGAEKYDTTAEASDLEAGDIYVEEINAEANELTVSLKESKACFVSADFSVYAFTTASDKGEEAEFAENGDTFTADKDAMKDTDKTWAEAQGKFSLKAKGAAKAPQRAGKNILEGYSDYSPYLTSHKLTVDDKEIKDGDTIDPSQSFQLQMQFRLTMSQMATDGKSYYFELPDHISIGDIGSEDSQLTLYNSNHVGIGTYFIKDDVLYVNFPGYYNEVVANFSQEASWSDTSGRATIDVLWGKTTEKYRIDMSDLQVSKKAGGYKRDENNLLYNDFTVTVQPKEADFDGTITGVTFTDEFRSSFMTIDPEHFTGDDGQKYAFCLTYIDSNGVIKDRKYYKLDDISTLTTNASKQNVYNIKIEDLTVADGGSLKFEYRGFVTHEDNVRMDAEGGRDAYYNSARVEYPVINPETGETEKPYSESSINGSHNGEGSWTFKSKGEDKNIKVQEEEVTIIPYTVQINRHRYYSLGGSAVHDEITAFNGGDVKPDVVYDIDNIGGEDPYIVKTDSNNNESTINQTWIVLDNSLYEELSSLVLAPHRETQLEALQADASLVSRLLAAINEKAGTSYTSFSNEVAEKFIFTSEDKYNFIWLMPLDESPTTYFIHYNTVASKSVGDFSNGAALWYTEYEGVPYGVGWSAPVKKVMNASKHNDGIYIGSDGNYYVDYTLTVGVEAGSAGFEDIFVIDNLPTYKIKDSSGKTIELVDWLVGLDTDSLNFAERASTEQAVKNNAPLNNDNIFHISSESDDPAVQAVVDRTHCCVSSGATQSLNINADIVSNQVKRGMYNRDIGNSAVIYDGDYMDAGQLIADRTNNFTEGSIRKGQTYTLKRVAFVLGNLPGTEKGYDIVFKYTMQINPYLVENLPEILAANGEDLAKLNNKASVRTTNIIKYPNGTIDKMLGLSDNAPLIQQNLISGYWIGPPEEKDIVKKSVASSGYNEENQQLPYVVKINDVDNKIMAEKGTYIIEDSLNVSGMKYAPGTMTLKDAGGNIIYTDDRNQSVAAQYEGIASATVTNNDSSSNSFRITLDNSSEVLQDEDGHFPTLTLEYCVDMKGFTTDLDLMNTTSLRLRTKDETTGNDIDKLLDEDTCEYAIDKALDKKLTEVPKDSNGYVAKYSISVNPESENAYELGEMSDGDTFTIKDTMSDVLGVLPDTVQVLQISNGTETDITSECSIKLDTSENILSAVVPFRSGVTYRLVYDARVQGEAGSVVRIKNTAEIEGTQVRPSEVDKKIRVYSYDASAAATNYYVQLNKFDSTNIKKGINASFNLYKYENRNWTLLTDGSPGYEPITTVDGSALITNKIVSDQPINLVDKNTWYKLVEIQTETGYLLDDTPVYFYASEDGSAPATIPSGIASYTIVTPLVVNGEETKQPPVVNVGNTKLQFSVLKTNKASSEPLAGAEFTLYSDEACTTELDKITTDEEGIAHFTDIESDGNELTLYLKETKTPDGFIKNEDTVYTLHFENGLVTSAVDSEGKAVTIGKEGIESRVTIGNTSVDGWVQVSKKVYSRDSNFDVSQDTFAFAVTLRDGSTLTEYTQGFPAYRISEDGTETPEGMYSSGSVFMLKNGEKLRIKELPPGTKFETVEVENNEYSTKVEVVDSVGGRGTAGSDTTYSVGGNKATGTVTSGELDDVRYENSRLGGLRVQKKAVNKEGEEIEIPDGLTISVQSSRSSSATIYLSAAWNASKGKFELVSKSSSKIQMDNSVDQGFIVTGLPETDVYVLESNTDTDELTGEMSYSTRGFDSSFTTGDYATASVRSSAAAELYLKNTYTSDFAEVTVKADKLMQGKPLKAGDFNFRLEKYNGSNFVVVGTDTNDDTGEVSFSLKYSENQVGTYYYRIVEVLPSGTSRKTVDGKTWAVKDGMWYTTDEIHIKVVVDKDDNGNLQVSAPVYSYKRDGESIDEPQFVNMYKAEGDVTLSAQKKVTKASAASAYTLRYTEVESDYETPVKDANDQEITGTITTPFLAANSTSDVLNFSKIKYTGSDVDKHYYLITEDIPDDAVDNVKDGIRYDDTKYRAEVDVSDNGNGTLKSDLKYMDGSGAELEEGAVPLFDNKYVASGSITFAGKKTMENVSFSEGDFTFLIEEFAESGRTTPVTDENGEPVTYSAEAGASSYDSATGKYSADISYPEIIYHYEDIGTHYYKVTEVVPTGAEGGAAVDGIKYDTRSYNITVTIYDAGNGKLRITTTGTPNALNFTNTYKATGTAEFKGTKTLEGKELTKDQFSFTADITKKKTDGTGSETTVATAKPFGTNSADGKISFPAQNYTEADIGYTYTYKIKEVVPADTKGVIYSDQEYTVSVKVEAGSKGVLELTTAYLDKDGETAESADFTNTYEASGSAKLVGVKHIENRTFREGDEWTFTISGKKAAADGEEAAPAPLPTDENGNEVTEVTVKPTSGSDVSFEFENISYTLEDAGTWIYTITESGDVEGVQNDTRTHTVTVTVEDKNTGTLDITVDYGKDAEGNALTAADFTNTYDAEGSIAVSGTKSITGREFREGDRWAFAITAGTEGAPMPVDSENKTVSYITIEPASGSQCNYEFGNIKFKLSDLKGEDSKVFRYTIRESGEVPGVHNDPDNDRTFEVEVTDLKNGSLDVKLTENSEDIAFTNDYRATGDITFGGKKSIDCRDLNVSGDHDVFEFTITGSDGTNKTFRNGADGTIAYPKIEYVLDKDHLDVIGDHTYRIAEKTVSQDGITKDSREYVVVIGVQDNGEGTLNIITKSITADNPGESHSEDPTENTLDFVNEYKAEGGITFAGVKSIDVRELKEGETYRFTIQETGLLGIAKGDPITAESDDTGKIDYPELKYYLDKERDDTGTHTYKVTEEAVDADGITSSSKQYTVKLNVTDQENGELDVQVADGSDDPAKLDFENAYAATGEITLQGRKTIDCRDLNVNGDHDVFEFTITGEDGYSETVKNDADGNIEYPVLKYVLDKDHPDALGDYTYTIEEKTTSQSGITKDSEKYTIVINVADNKDGTLAVTAKSVTAANGGGTDAAPADDAGADAAPADDSGDNTAPAGDAIELTESNLNFVNEYRAEGSFTFKGTKSIDTRDLLSGERYSFTIQEYDENGEKVGDPLTAYSDDSGTINYPEISYELNKDRNDLGVHTYRVSEDASEAGGITTSSEVYTVKIKVTDLEDGTLEAVAAEDSEDPEKLDFENHYEAYGNASFKVTKQLDGRKWENKDSFRIELKAVGGAPMPEGTEAGSNVKVVNITKSSSFLGESFTETFGDIDFSKEDMKTNGKYVGEKTFEYKVREIKGNDRNIEYDKNVYTVKVTVFDNNNGSLITSTEFFNGGKKLNSLKFVNTYKADRKGVKTGDDTHIALWLTLMILTAGCLAGMLVYRRRRA